jgi:hypothetical protein
LFEAIITGLPDGIFSNQKFQFGKILWQSVYFPSFWLLRQEKSGNPAL